MQQRNMMYRPFPGDEHLVVKFYMDDVKNERLTIDRGYAVYEDVETVSIAIPGDKQTTVVAPAASFCTMGTGEVVTYAQRFPDDYERWKQGQSAAMVGMPLKNAPFLSKAEVSMLAGLNIFTVEQLSEMGGAPLRNMGPQGRKWQQQAAAFLQAAQGSRDSLADAAEKAAMMERIASLEAALARVSGEAAPAEPADDEKTALKDQIEAITGARPRGNPSVETLRAALAEIQQDA